MKLLNIYCLVLLPLTVFVTACNRQDSTHPEMGLPKPDARASSIPVSEGSSSATGASASPAGPEKKSEAKSSETAANPLAPRPISSEVEFQHPKADLFPGNARGSELYQRLKSLNINELCTRFSDGSLAFSNQDFIRKGSGYRGNNQRWGWGIVGRCVEAPYEQIKAAVFRKENRSRPRGGDWDCSMSSEKTSQNTDEFGAVITTFTKDCTNYQTHWHGDLEWTYYEEQVGGPNGARKITYNIFGNIFEFQESAPGLIAIRGTMTAEGDEREVNIDQKAVEDAAIYLRIYSDQR